MEKFGEADENFRGHAPPSQGLEPQLGLRLKARGTVTRVENLKGQRAFKIWDGDGLSTIEEFYTLINFATQLRH